MCRDGYVGVCVEHVSLKSFSLELQRKSVSLKCLTGDTGPFKGDKRAILGRHNFAPRHFRETPLRPTFARPICGAGVTGTRAKNAYSARSSGCDMPRKK